MALILVVLARYPFRARRERRAFVTMKFFTGLIDTDNRPGGIIGAGIDGQDIFHFGDEARTRFGDAPLLVEPGLEVIVLKAIADRLRGNTLREMEQYDVVAQ